MKKRINLPDDFIRDAYRRGINAVSTEDRIEYYDRNPSVQQAMRVAAEFLVRWTVRQIAKERKNG